MSDLRYDAVLYAGTELRADGTVDEGDLTRQFQALANQWQEDGKYPYVCINCDDEGWKTAEDALAHVGMKVAP